MTLENGTEKKLLDPQMLTKRVSIVCDSSDELPEFEQRFNEPSLSVHYVLFGRPVGLVGSLDDISDLIIDHEIQRKLTLNSLSPFRQKFKPNSCMSYVCLVCLHLMVTFTLPYPGSSYFIF